MALAIDVHRIPGRSCKAKGRRAAVVVAIAVVDDECRDLATYFWTLHSGYAARRERGRTIFMQHDVAGRVGGRDVSHIDGDKLNNRRANLEHATRSENMLNPADGPRVNHKSCSHRGVTRDDQTKALARPWRGKVSVAGRTYQTRRFVTAEEAKAALDDLRRSLGLRVREYPAPRSAP